jgi:hypothetical protein
MFELDVDAAFHVERKPKHEDFLAVLISAHKVFRSDEESGQLERLTAAYKSKEVVEYDGVVWRVPQMQTSSFKGLHYEFLLIRAECSTRGYEA